MTGRIGVTNAMTNTDTTVTTNTAQTISGAKTFTSDISVQGIIQSNGRIYSERENTNNSTAIRADNGNNWSGLYCYMKDNGEHWLSEVAYVNGTASGNKILTVADGVTTGTSQQITAEKTFTSASQLMGRFYDQYAGGTDLHLDSANDNTNYVARICIRSYDDGSARVFLERWTKGIDSNGLPYASSFVDQVLIASLGP